jgi:hypothetical protein
MDKDVETALSELQKIDKAKNILRVVHRRKRAVPQKKTRAELIAEFDSFPHDTRITEDYAAAKRGCSTALLQRERVFGSPIPFIREGGKIATDKNGQTRIFGGRVFYIKSDILAFLDARNKLVSSNCEAASMYLLKA